MSNNFFCPPPPPPPPPLQDDFIPKFRYWCQTTLPTVYDDSLSYYELLNKVVAHLNTVTDSQNNILYAFSKLNLTKEATVVTPESFGAKADGESDDYESIQKMFDETRGGVVVFNPQKQYRVTKPINIYGGYGTLTVLLGSILYDGLITDDAVITLKEELSKGDSFGRGGIKIIGGYVNANKMCGCGIRIYDTYHSCLTNVKVANYMRYGIDIGSDNVLTGAMKTRSTQAMITSCYIDNFSNGFNGSAIRCVHTDNNISNCVTNGGQYGIELVYGGNFISNCHFTVYADVIKNPGLDVAFIYNNVISTTAVQTNSFDNCYFNGSTKYVVQNSKDNSLVTMLNNCSVILGTDKQGYTCYLKNSFDSAMQINDLNVRKSKITKLIGLSTQAQTAGILSRTSITVKNGADRTQNTADIVNLDKSPAVIVSDSMPLKQNMFRRVATVLSPANLDIGSSFTISLAGYSIATITVGHNKFSVEWNLALLGFSDIHLYLDKERKKFDFGNDVVMYGYNVYITTTRAEERSDLITCLGGNNSEPFVHQFVYTGKDNDFEVTDYSDYLQIL